MMPVPAEPIEVLEVGVTISESGEPFPTVVLDVADRPDVADLARVHSFEGIGDLVTFVDSTGDGLVLTVELTRPVVARFAVRFLLPEHWAVLADAALAGHLLLATSPPGAPQSLNPVAPNPVWLAIDLDGARLAAVLAGHRPTDNG